MNKRWAPGFTIVELLIVIIVVAILATITTMAYLGVRRSTQEKTAQNDLYLTSIAMERALQQSSTYPTSLPGSIKASANISLELKISGSSPYYKNINPVQNGVLFATICDALINEGVGRGVNQGGVTQNYITGCGNWNNNSTQIAGWNNKVWNTPVDSAALTDYANTFTTGDNYNKAAHENVVKNFYGQLVSRFTQQGGTFPITTFWDYWATPTNGGVTNEPLPENPSKRPYYCVEAKSNTYQEIIWHISQDREVKAGAC